MIEAERKALAADILSRRQDVRNMDLNNLVTFLDGLSTQAALLAGFAFAGLATVEPGTHVFWKLILYVPTVCTLGCMLFVVCVGQLATLLAPTLALNGPTGSINRAVVGVRLERRRIFAVFTAGLVFFFIEIVGMVAMTVEDVWLAWLCEIIMVSFFAAIAHYSVKQTKAFAFEAAHLHSLVALEELDKDMDNDFGAANSAVAASGAAADTPKTTSRASLIPEMMRGKTKKDSMSAAEFLGLDPASGAGSFESGAADGKRSSQ